MFNIILAFLPGSNATGELLYKTVFMSSALNLAANNLLIICCSSLPFKYFYFGNTNIVLHKLSNVHQY